MKGQFPQQQPNQHQQMVFQLQQQQQQLQQQLIEAVKKLIEAVKNGHFAEVERLLRDPIVTPAYNDNIIIKLAAENGHLEIVQLLLRDPRVDPCNMTREKFNPAITKGKDKRDAYTSNETGPENAPVNLATKNGHTKVVEVLLKDQRVNQTNDHHETIKYAAKLGWLEIVNLLLTNSNADPLEENHAAHRVANGRIYYIESCAGMFSRNNNAISLAAAHNHFAIVNRIINYLNDNKKDVSVAIKSAISKSAEYGSLEMLKYLIDYSASNGISIDITEALRTANYDNNVNTVKFLLAHLMKKSENDKSINIKKIIDDLGEGRVRILGDNPKEPFAIKMETPLKEQKYVYHSTGLKIVQNKELLKNACKQLTNNVYDLIKKEQGYILGMAQKRLGYFRNIQYIQIQRDVISEIGIGKAIAFHNLITGLPKGRSPYYLPVELAKLIVSHAVKDCLPKNRYHEDTINNVVNIISDKKEWSAFKEMNTPKKAANWCEAKAQQNNNNNNTIVALNNAPKTEPAKQNNHMDVEKEPMAERRDDIAPKPQAKKFTLTIKNSRAPEKMQVEKEPEQQGTKTFAAEELKSDRPEKKVRIKQEPEQENSSGFGR
jgi:hypothetical protein